MLNLDEIRQEFPVVERWLYLNHAAVSPISRRVRTTIEGFVQDHHENAAMHTREWEARHDAVRHLAARLVNAGPDEIAFVKNTSEGLSFAANGIEWKHGDNVVITNVEFPANVYPWLNLQRRGVEVRFVAERSGRVAVDDIRAAVDARTRAVSLSLVEYGNGFRNDIASIGALCREHGILFIVDGIQALGALQFDLKETPVDILTADAHKWLMGPEGIGMFYCSREVMDRITLYEVGWHTVAHAEDYATYDFTLAPDARRFECGTLNTVGIYGLGAALELILDVGIEVIEERLRVLTDGLIEGLRRKDYRILSPRGDDEWSGIVTFASDRYSVQDLHKTLRSQNIITARRGGGVRVSPHYYNTEDELRRVVEALP
ncbi:MAG: aminotransferase class V-fold PLP-dependent enzyme [Candidatus Latescibacteria bacterium]|nr:aminotransferase class V-fold PLP-dependent enzyme [Candidatus Latescibacterota bacterium]